MLCDTRVIYAKKIPTYMNGDINKRYAYCEPSYERKETEKETEDGISVQKEAENKDSGQNTSEQNETLKGKLREQCAEWEFADAGFQNALRYGRSALVTGKSAFTTAMCMLILTGRMRRRTKFYEREKNSAVSYF